MDNKNLKIVYRYNPISIGGIIVLLLSAMPLISSVNRGGSASQNKFYDSITGEIITPGFDQSGFVLNIILLIVFAIGLVIAIKNLKISFYEITCPYCGKITYIRTNVEGADCETCNQRIIMVNGQPAKVDIQ